MKRKIINILILLVLPSYLSATVLINSDAGIQGVLTFSPEAVGTKAYNPATGIFYLGLTAAASDNLNVAQFSRPITGQQLKFIGRAGSDLSGQAIDFLTLINAPGKTDPLLTGVRVNTPGSLNQTQIAVQTTLPTNAGTIASTLSAALLGVNDAVPTANGPAISGIAGTAAGIARDTGRNFIFAAVNNLVLTDTNGFGSEGSGIAVVNPILTVPGLPNSPSIQVNQVAAQPGQTGIKAARLDPTSPQISINQNATITLDRVSLFWDDPLQRLYIGLQLVTANDAAAGARSVVVGRLQANEQGELNFDNFLPNAALMAGQQTNIVGVIGAASVLSAAQLSVMHVSTGPSYLILQGGNGIITTNTDIANGTVGNLIWALPLVDLKNFKDPNQGLLANKNMFNILTHQFEVPAAVNADLTAITDQFAQVGAGPLPLEPYTPIFGAGSGSGQTPSLPRNSLDINVVGDTVYVAISSAQTDLDDTGVFYSQAMFDSEGKIIRWTPWAKRAFTFDAFPTVPENKGEVRFINVDPVTGNMVGVEGKNGQAVTMTGWNTTPYAAQLPTLLNKNLSSGSLSVLDLDQTTTGLAEDGPSRYTLFGGTNSVVFARTALSRVQTPPYNEINGHPAPQKLTTFINSQGNLVPANFLVTHVGDACIGSLEYSRRSTNQGDTNYFFAGSHSGLYVFADAAGNGFNSNALGAPNLGALNEPPFSDRTWQRIASIPGAVVDIKTSGAVLYVMTVSRNTSGAMQSIIYSIDYQNNINTMFDPLNLNIIAQSQVDNLSTTKAFYGMQIIQMGTSEQLIIATNNGLYMSFLTGGVQNALNQIQADWRLIDNSQNIFWRGIAGVDTPLPSTVWPFSLTDPTGRKIYNQSNITQLTGGNTVGNDGVTPILSQFNPENFNSNGSLPGFNSFNPITYFSTDGLRRYLITQPLNVPGQNSSLVVSPFDVAASRLASPTTLANLALNSVSTLNWAKQIGATGSFMVGTNSGVVAFD
jgi:hypothetical protein